jgi:hypothetical protein
MNPERLSTVPVNHETIGFSEQTSRRVLRKIKDLPLETARESLRAAIIILNHQLSGANTPDQNITPLQEERNACQYIYDHLDEIFDPAKTQNTSQ